MRGAGCTYLRGHRKGLLLSKTWCGYEMQEKNGNEPETITWRCVTTATRGGQVGEWRKLTNSDSFCMHPNHAPYLVNYNTLSTMHSTLPVHQTILPIHSSAVQKTPRQVNQPRPPLAARPVQKRRAKLLFPFGRSGPVWLQFRRRLRQQ